MDKKFLNFIISEKLFPKNAKLLVAVSAGVDSIVLTHLLKNNGYHFIIAHCNFGLRNSDSDKDEMLVKKIAKELKIKSVIKSFSTVKYAKDNKISIQMAARKLRYAWFNELLSKYKLDYITTAHHLNDSLETAIFNFTKGGGIAGLRGINASNNNKVRPLLFATKQMILQYAQSNNLLWREDNSNKSNKYHRNLIRNKVIPKLKKINPTIENTFHNTSKKMLSIERLINSQSVLLSKKTRNVSSTIFLAIEKIRDTEIVVAEKYLSNFGFNSTQTQLLMEMIKNKKTGKQLFSKNYVLNVDRENIIISLLKKIKNFNCPVRENETLITPIGKLTFKNTNDLTIPKINSEAKIDSDLLSYPLSIRRWKKGDWFNPLGMQKKKKLSDFMIDEKIPLNLKDNIYVLTSNNDIVWVIGYRIDNRFKITTHTKNACYIRLKND